MTKEFPDSPSRLHFVGIKGQGMTALAQIFQGYGYEITGSDVAEIFPTDAVLQRLGISVTDSFEADHVNEKVAAVIYSTAYSEENPERLCAKELGIPQWSYPEAASLFFETHSQSVAIAGSHGKTTTTALLGHVLEEGGFDPTVIVGSIDLAWASNARVGQSDWFVLEADEYQNKFQFYAPRYLMITNIDYDHPDYFVDRQAYENTFLDFVSRLPDNGVLVVWGEDPFVLSLRANTKAKVVTYGKTAECDWQLTNVSVTDQKTSFSIANNGNNFGHFSIPFAGDHYALNAAGVITLAHVVGVKNECIERAVHHFRGTSRRMERRGEYRGCLVIDDFAHHPTEISATLRGLRAEYPKRRLVVVFHPHTFSRTKALLDEFVTALSLADIAYLLPIYGSAREERGQVASEDIVEKINARNPHKASVVNSIEEAIVVLKSQLTDQDILVTMGAGDVWRVAEGVVA